MELKPKFGEYGNIDTNIECEYIDTATQGSVSFCYEPNSTKKPWEKNKDQAYEAAFKVIKLLTEEDYTCIIKDEGSVLVVEYTYNWEKAQEFGCATYVPLDVETYRQICALQKQYELEHDVEENLDDLEFQEATEK